MRPANKPLQREVLHSTLVLANRIGDPHSMQLAELAQTPSSGLPEETPRQVPQIAQETRLRRKRVRDVRRFRQRVLSSRRRVHRCDHPPQLELLDDI